MGWWNIQGTNDAIGDLPLDALGEAVSAVLAQRAAEFGRRPTRAEWEALLRAVPGAEEPEYNHLIEAR